MEAEGQKVRLILNNGFRYTGKILAADEEKIIILDKFDQKVIIKRELISLWEETN